MSRIGKAKIAIPDGVSVERKGREVSVKGPKGNLSQRVPADITMEVADGQIHFKRPNDSKPMRAFHGMARALVNNMVQGVTEGFTKELTIIGVGYRAEASGKTLKLSVGYSHPVEMAIPEGLQVSVNNNTEIKVEGIDRQLLGQFAADVRSVRPPEPYKGKGIRYADERVRRKVGKAGATAG